MENEAKETIQSPQAQVPTETTPEQPKGVPNDQVTLTPETKVLEEAAVAEKELVGNATDDQVPVDAQNVDALDHQEDNPEEEAAQASPGDQETTDAKKSVGKKPVDVQQSQKQKQAEAQERRKKLAEEAQTESRLAEEAAKETKIVLSIECCINCAEHQYCTHHKEDKYREYFRALKVEIEKLNPDIHVGKNVKICKPQIGALEVRWKDTLIYSKLKEMKWPNAELVAKRLVETRDLEARAQAEAKLAAEQEAIRKQAEEEAKALAEAAKKQQEEEEAMLAEQKRVEVEVIKETTMGTESFAPEVDARFVDKENENVMPTEQTSAKKQPMQTEDNEEEAESRSASNVLKARDMNTDREVDS
jgi:hypothetical protein